MLLDITENCNLRCKYCVYGGTYDNRRGYSGQCMSIDVLKRSILFFKSLKMGRCDQNYVTISFYGGEPTLEQETILNGINFSNEVFGDKKTSFIITTNGTVGISKELQSVVNKNNVSWHLSLDGPEEENDKFRVHANGDGTFKKIEKFIKEHSNDFFHIQVTLHPDHNWDEIDNYLSFIAASNSRIKLHINFFLLQSYNGVDIAILSDRMLIKQELLQNIILAKIVEGRPLSAFQEAYIKGLEKTYHFDFNPFWGKKIVRNTCYPGEVKLAVNPSGDIHICERVADYFNIGDVNKGLNLTKIKKIWKETNMIFEGLNCADCPLQNFCLQCFALIKLNKLNNRYIFNCDLRYRKTILRNIKFMIQIALFKGKGELNV